MLSRPVPSVVLRRSLIALASLVLGQGHVLGQRLRLQVANVPNTRFQSCDVLGFGKLRCQGLPLPRDLGLPGCSALNSADLSYPLGLPNASGIAPWNLSVPNLSFLLGMELYLQALSFEAPGFTRWASVSNGLVVRVGNR